MLFLEERPHRAKEARSGCEHLRVHSQEMAGKGNGEKRWKPLANADFVSDRTKCRSSQAVKEVGERTWEEGTKKRHSLMLERLWGSADVKQNEKKIYRRPTSREWERS